MKSKGALFFSELFFLTLIINFASSNFQVSAYIPNSHPPIPQSTQFAHILYLPIILGGSQPHQRYYVQAEKLGTFYGIWATIETPNPVIREPYFSYASINIISPDAKWIEVGINKGIYTECTSKFSWAIQPGDPHIILNPLPQVGIPYQFMIEKVSDGNWLLRIMNTNGVVIYQTNINNPGMNSGVRLQAVGEVNSPQQLNDLGVSGILTLRWQMSNLIWSNWDGWTLGINDNPPYVIQGVLPDESNNVQIFGNNGNPVPPDAPCPE